MPEWLMGTDCKSVSIAYVGSNPTRPSYRKFNVNPKCIKRLLTTYNRFASLKVKC